MNSVEAFEYLHEQFTAAVATLGGTEEPGIVNNIVQIVKECYKDRNYHSLEWHVVNIMQIIISIYEEEIGIDNAESTDIAKLILACIFHDLIYDGTRKDNEEKSANIAVDFLYMMGIEEDDAEEIRSLIMVTKNNPRDKTGEYNAAKVLGKGVDRSSGT